MADQVMQYLCEVCTLDFSKCRGQSYDNAANMSGRYKGMQQKVLEQNKYAIYVPCVGHSINLVGQSAVDLFRGSYIFLNSTAVIYIFFSLNQQMENFKRLSGK